MAGAGDLGHEPSRRPLPEATEGARLREDAPPVLYGCGDAVLLATGGLAVVGSRHVDDELIEYTEGLGRLAAAAGQSTGRRDAARDRARARREVRANVTIDWTLRENVRAHLRVLVKRILRKHGYPPDKQEKATQTVLEQAEVLSQEWAAAA